MACGSHRIARSLSTGAGDKVLNVIGTKGKVSDAVAAFFSQNLYLALASRSHSLPKAFAMAQDAVRVSPLFCTAEADRFVLYQKGVLSSAGRAQTTGITNSTKIFGKLAGRQVTMLQDQDDSSTLPSLGEDFVGREVDMYRVLRSVARRRLVVVCSPSSSKDRTNGGHRHGIGIGKSSIVLGVAHRLQQRRFGCGPSAQHFKDGIIFIRGASSVEDICAHWIDQLQKIQRNDNNGTQTFSQQQHQGAPTVVYADRTTNTPLIVQLMRLARLAQHTLVIIDDCAAALTRPGSQASLCLHNFLCGLLQSLPRVRILITAQDPLFVSTDDIVPQQQQHIQLNHSFKPLIVQVGGLSNMASARLLVRRAHRKISLAEALNGNEHFGGTVGESPSRGGAEEHNQNVVKALARHPLIIAMRGHPCNIAKMALKITDALPSIGSLIMRAEDGAEKTAPYVYSRGTKTCAHQG
jgi:hypothetical protein